MKLHRFLLIMSTYLHLLPVSTLTIDLFVNMTHAGWWFASYRGKEGWVPASFLEREDPSIALPSEQTNKVLLPTDTAEANDPIPTKTSLGTREDVQTFSKGDVIQVLNKSNSGWWRAM